MPLYAKHTCPFCQQTVKGEHQAKRHMRDHTRPEEYVARLLYASFAHNMLQCRVFVPCQRMHKEPRHPEIKLDYTFSRLSVRCLITLLASTSNWEVSQHQLY